MSELKKQLTKIIRDEYQDWFASRNVSLKCEKGCATCCSVNVKTTSIEGELIYDFIKEHNREEWFAHVLNQPQSLVKVKQTTNGFAKACLSGELSAQVDVQCKGQCPFLKDTLCTIYEVRPFSCRCFVSNVLCDTEATAEIEQLILSASTVIMQLLEHVSHREYWGNLVDVLLALSDLPGNKAIKKHLNLSIDMQGRARVVSSEPIPGFLLDNVEYNTIMALVEKIFNRTIDGKRVEDILNGK